MTRHQWGVCFIKAPNNAFCHRGGCFWNGPHVYQVQFAYVTDLIRNGLVNLFQKIQFSSKPQLRKFTSPSLPWTDSSRMASWPYQQHLSCIHAPSHLLEHRVRGWPSTVWYSCWTTIQKIMFWQMLSSEQKCIYMASGSFYWVTKWSTLTPFPWSINGQGRKHPVQVKNMARWI